jgi:hypothetical protein
VPSNKSIDLPAGAICKSLVDSCSTSVIMAVLEGIAKAWTHCPVDTDRYECCWTSSMASEANRLDQLNGRQAEAASDDIRICLKGVVLNFGCLSQDDC